MNARHGGGRKEGWKGGKAGRVGRCVLLPPLGTQFVSSEGVEVERRRLQDGEGEISLWFLPAWIAENDEALTTTAPLRLKLTISLSA